MVDNPHLKEGTSSANPASWFASYAHLVGITTSAYSLRDIQHPSRTGDSFNRIVVTHIGEHLLGKSKHLVASSCFC